MPKIMQQDITPGAISLTTLANFTITTTSTFLQGNVSVTSYTLGTSTALAVSDPLQIHDGLNTSVTGWSEEQDLTIYNAACTTVMPWFDGSPGVVTPTTAVGTIVTGDLVGIYGAAAWAASGNLNVSRAIVAGFGRQRSALICTGVNNSGAVISSSELFNGSSWLSGANLNISKTGAAGTGSQNAGLVAGGNNSITVIVTELFNGASWATSGNLNITRTDITGAGSQNAALVMGGFTGAAALSSTELFNGTSWVASANSSASRYSSAGCGSQNAALVSGGASAAATETAKTELFNGSTWTISGNLTTIKQSLGGAGSQNAGLVAGGTISGPGDDQQNRTELFNGSSWSLSGVISVSKSGLGGAGSQNAGLVAGGQLEFSAGSPPVMTTELHNQTLYRKLTYNNFREAKNIGIATDVVGSTVCNVKIVGYLNNMTVTSSNTLITTDAQWHAAGQAGYYAVLPRFSVNTNTTTTPGPGSILFKATVEADDYLVGQLISQTQMIVFNSNVFTKDNIGNF